MRKTTIDVYRGRSTDNKPPNAKYGSRFFEEDNNKWFTYDADSRAWIPDGGGVTGTAGGIILTAVTDTHLTSIQDITDYLAGIADYELAEAMVHKWTILKQGYLYLYTYIGALPIQSQTAVIGDFFVESKELPVVSGAQLLKDAANTNPTTLQVNDEVYFKKITNSGDPKTLIGFTYDGGDEQLLTSYTQNQSITT